MITASPALQISWDRRTMAIQLQSAGLLSTLIFLINSIYEILYINGLHQAHYFLIALLLGALSLWAWFEVAAV